jgi:hypothetical protein
MATGAVSDPMWAAGEFAMAVRRSATQKALINLQTITRNEQQTMRRAQSNAGQQRDALSCDRPSDPNPRRGRRVRSSDMHSFDSIMEHTRLATDSAQGSEQASPIGRGFRYYIFRNATRTPSCASPSYPCPMTSADYRHRSQFN